MKIYQLSQIPPINSLASFPTCCWLNQVKSCWITIVHWWNILIISLHPQLLDDFPMISVWYPLVNSQCFHTKTIEHPILIYFGCFKPPCSKVNPHYIAILSHRCVDGHCPICQVHPNDLFQLVWSIPSLFKGTSSWNIPKSKPKSIIHTVLSHIFEACSLVNCNRLLLKMLIEIVDLPIKKWWFSMMSHDFPWFSMILHDFPWFSMIFHDFPSLCKRLPEA